MASKVSIEKCNDVDLPIDTANDIYRLKTGTRKEIHYLVTPKDCNIYVQMHENERILFKTLRKMNEQDVPKRTSTHISKICCCISQKFRQVSIFFGLSIVASLIGSEHMQGMSAVKMQRPPHHSLKCPGVHCSYSCGQTHGFPCKYAFPGVN